MYIENIVAWLCLEIRLTSQSEILIFRSIKSLLQRRCPKLVLAIESTKTTSMEHVSTGVLEKIKNI